MSHRITADAARKYWAHPTQQKASGVTPEGLTDEGFEYWAAGGVCLAFHRVHWPEVWMTHIGVTPSAWGKTTGPTRQLLNAFWADRSPELIIAWLPERNRAVLSLAQRVGFQLGGQMPLSSENITYVNWRPACPLARR